MTEQERKRVREAVDGVVALILEYAGTWGPGATEKMCQVFSKAVVWVSAFGTGRFEANAKNHIFSGRATTKTYD